MKLAREQGLEVRETAMPREMLYLADEMFFTGTAARSRRSARWIASPIGAGRRGPITEKLQQAFFGLFSGATAGQAGVGSTASI